MSLNEIRGRVASRLVWTALLLLATIRPCCALDPAKRLSQYVHTVWDDGHGLPKNAEIRKILQTSDGYLWLATDAGLVRFNGSEFALFSSANTPAFKYNDVQVLFEDLQHTLWIATSNGAYHGDLIRYRQGSFQRIAANEGPGSFSVVSIVSNTAGDIWFGTANHGIFRYRDGRFTGYSLPGGYNLLLTLSLDRHGDLWACAGSGLLHFERDGFVRDDRVPELSAKRIQVFDLAESPDGEWSVATTGTGLVAVPALASPHAAPKLPAQRRFVSQARFDRQGALWFAEQTGGLYRWKAQHLDRFKPGNGADPLDVEALYEDRIGSLWVGTTDQGVCRVPNSKANQPLDCFTEKNGLRGGAVMSMLEDREGSIWIGTAGGTLERFKDNALTLYGKSEGLASQVRSLYESHDRSVWLGTDSGLVRFDNAKPVTFLAPFGAANNRVRSIAEDRKGNIWTGTAYGLNQFAKKGIKTFPAPDVVAIHPDREGGVWFAQSTMTMGINRLLDGKTQAYFDRPRSEQAIVSVIQEDRAGTLWLGTAGGVSRFDGRNKTDFRIQEGDTDSSGVTYYTPGVTQVFEDADRVLWIGTHHSGLWRLKENHLTGFNTADGLYDNSVYGVVEDDYGFLWLTGWRGISRVKKSELNDLAAHKISNVSPILYGVSDRAEGAGCTAGGQSPALKTFSGSLLFTCMKGVVSVDPSHLPFNSTPPPVHIEQVLLNGLHVSRNARTPVGEGDVEFHYAALSYLAPEKVQYKYRLVGYDKDWISPGNRHVAYYTNLPPGDYTFQVVACNNDGVWNNEGAAFSFYLQPHFYQTTWFLLLCILGALALIVEIYRLRLRRIRKHERELVSLVDMRTYELKKEIARRRQAQEAAQQAKEAAESATRAKSEFLANMSHEIRTPLHGVIGTLELARETDPTPEQSELLGMAHESANSLRVVIDDILDFSKIEAGKLAFECAAFDLADAVADAARSVAIRAHQKKLELAWAVSPGIPPVLLGDATRLKQVLINLLGNAIKFTARGEIVLRVDAGRRQDGKIPLRFSVSDTGIGIPKDKQKLIFEAFAQEDATTTRKFGGTGLGLTICSRIVKLMEGEIWVDSEPGKGATFYFTSIFQVAEGKISPLSEAIVELQGVRVLIVDDNLTNRRILEGILKSWGMLPVAADSGAAGLELMRQAAEDACPFRLVLADCQMPEMDGFQFIERVKETPGLAAPAIMMLSSDDFNGTPQRCRTLGLAGSLIKPVRQSELLAAIHAALQPDEKRAAHAAAEPALPVRQLTILLAEDNPVNQRLAVRLLEKAGHRVLVANNGREALEILNRETADLVLMDIQMPEMDGLTATGLIREKEQRTGMHVPVIAMTAHAMTGDRERMMAAGMDDYVSKPIDIKRLRETINRIAGKVDICTK